MGSKSLLGAFCLLSALAAVACSDDDTVDNGTGGGSAAGGKGTAGAAGRAGGATGGEAGGGETGGTSTGGASTGGASTGGGAGEAGMAGTGGGGTACTDFTKFVHTIVAQDTTATAVPRPVNGVVFCPDPADPAAYKDLF